MSTGGDELWLCDCEFSFYRPGWSLKVSQAEAPTVRLVSGQALEG